jgi:hypothetical protein
MTSLAVPSPSAVARLLAGNGQVELRSAEALPLVVQIIGGFGPYLQGRCATRATLPTSVLTCRVPSDQGEPCLVTLRLSGDQKVHGSQTVITLEVVQVAEAAPVREHPRVQVHGTAWLEALECTHLAPGEMVDATPIDISTTGIGLATDGDLHPADMLQLHARLADEKLIIRVHVASIRYSQTLRQHILGCTFLSASPANQATLDRILHA